MGPQTGMTNDRDHLRSNTKRKSSIAKPFRWSSNPGADCRIVTRQLNSSLKSTLNMSLTSTKEDNEGTKISKAEMKKNLVVNVLHSQKEVQSSFENTTSSNIDLKHEVESGQDETDLSVQEFWYNGEVHRHIEAIIKLTGTLQSWMFSDCIGSTSLPSSTPATLWKLAPGSGDSYQLSLRLVQGEVHI